MSKEAMKLALGALEWITQQRTGGMIQRKATEATTAIKQALEQPVQEPVAMRMPKVGDRVVCIDDESLGTVVYLTAGGSPEIKFDDGSHGTYMLREFAELFGYTSPAQEIVCSTGLCHYKPAAPVQPVASLKKADVLMIAEAHGIDPSTKGLYGFYIDCISTTPPAAAVKPTKDVEISNMGKPFTVKAYVTPTAAQPAPVQEPVAYWIPKAEQFCIADPSGRPFAKAWEPLYTTPPAAQRPWVGLTNAEMLKLQAEASVRHYRNTELMRGKQHSSEDEYLSIYARAIEAKLKEKNT